MVGNTDLRRRALELTIEPALDGFACAYPRNDVWIAHLVLALEISIALGLVQVSNGDGLGMTATRMVISALGHGALGNGSNFNGNFH